MIGCLPPKFRLANDYFIANIALPETDEATGLERPNRDPRKMRIKPDAYAATVEHTGPDCTLKPGDRIVVERMEWIQTNVDDERIIAPERDVLVVNGKPVRGASVVETEDLEKPRTTSLEIFEYRPVKREYVFGRIVATDSERFKVGDAVWLAKSERNQWGLGGKGMIFRDDEKFILGISREAGN